MFLKPLVMGSGSGITLGLLDFWILSLVLYFMQNTIFLKLQGFHGIRVDILAVTENSCFCWSESLAHFSPPVDMCFFLRKLDLNCKGTVISAFTRLLRAVMHQWCSYLQTN
jgi:hypothetical protein